MEEDLTKQFKPLFDKHISQYAQTNQYGVSMVPYHVHNGIDSPQIDPVSLLGFPTTLVSSASTAPTDTPVNGTIRFYYDGTYYVQWARINNTWQSVRLNNPLNLWVAPHVLFDHYASVGNVGTGEDNLYNDTIAAGQLANNGEKLEVEYGGSFVSSASATREIRVYFGSNTLFDSGALTLSLSAAWTIYISIIRVSSTVIRYMISMTTEGAALAAYTSVGEVTGLTLSGGNALLITGEAAGVGAATNDIVAKLGSVTWYPAA